MGLPSFALALSILNFVGSVSSSIGSGFIILCYLILPLRRHFRHILILNLAIADFLNSTNNAASGSLILIKQRYLKPGPGCVLNGFMSQISVQGTDTAILAITLVTVFTITRTSSSRMIQTEWSRRAILVTCCAIWALPFFTSFLALGKGWYGPVSGNWCWLVEKPVPLRYVLTHGWRYLFIVIEIALSIYLHFYLRRHFQTLKVPVVSSAKPQPSFSPMTFRSGPPPPESKTDIVIHITHDTRRDSTNLRPTITSESSDSNVPLTPRHETATSEQGVAPAPVLFFKRRESFVPPDFLSQQESPRYKAIQRILLLNAYPLFYIILWIPGLANRMVEASGNKSKVTQIMQASTQFVGLANALTYGWNERIARELRAKYMRHKLGPELPKY
ncbi:hypothetical protein CCMSSC00406_0009934 [Pleurotus cornucopiae]|uniref:Uncharacterized protein n=1 Tax=Pleurotus cornucopiae TaxID=5321 RepID=A0ACB7IT18_PLECO|nr:hypothetical protein CCMSSC00406_0009934 [Pleurotus cornucopiae]